MEKEYRKIHDLGVWGQNPRSITKDNFNHLKNLLRKYNQFKPVIINKANVVVGGNMRLRAMLDIRLGKTDADRIYMENNPYAFENVWVSVVDASTDAKMLEYSLADNESVGDWEKQELAELLTENWADMEMTDYKIDIQKIDLKDILEEFGPEKGGGEKDPLLDEKIKCPNCGFEFDPEDNGH